MQKLWKMLACWQRPDPAKDLSVAEADWVEHVRRTKPDLYRSALRVARAAGDESPRGLVFALRQMLS